MIDDIETVVQLLRIPEIQRNESGGPGPSAAENVVPYVVSRRLVVRLNMIHEDSIQVEPLKLSKPVNEIPIEVLAGA